MRRTGAEHCAAVLSEDAQYARARCAEARHRLVVRAGIALLLVISVTPAAGRSGGVVGPLLNQCRQVLEQCTLALRAAGAPLRWVPLALLAAGVVYAIADRVRLSRRVSRFIRCHDLRPVHTDEVLGRLADDLQCTGRVFVVVGSAPNPAFTAGLLKPRIYLAENLDHTLTPEELRAVFRHELYHLVRYDPLRFAALRFAEKTFFWLPIISSLLDDFREDAEVMADDFAAALAGGSDPLDVASAIVKIGQTNERTLAKFGSGVAAISGFRAMDRRVRRLANEVVVAPLPLRWRPTLLSMVALTVLSLSSALGPQAVDAGMTMRVGDRCPRVMIASDRHCPKCDESRARPMPHCGH
jgi:Zn-dependent protease with chaperone function